MRNLNLLTAIIILLIAPFAAGAQIVDAKPDVKIDCPSETFVSGETIRLTATTKPKLDGATFNWTVSSGTITSGQGTPSIEFQTAKDQTGEITATLNIGGNFFFEPLSDSCTISVYQKPETRLVTEGGIFSPTDELEHINGFLAEFEQLLMNDPTAQGYVIYYSRADKRREAVSTLKSVEQWAKKRDFLSGRLVIINGGMSAGTLFQYYIVPAGAEPPKPSMRIEPRYTVQANASACELNGLYLFTLRTELANNPNQSVYIVFSPGKDETALVNQKRQSIFIKTIEKNFPTLTTAVGDKTVGSGEVAVFLKKPGGEDELFLMIYAIKNKSVCLNCCEPSDMPKSLNVRKKVKRKKRK